MAVKSPSTTILSHWCNVDRDTVTAVRVEFIHIVVGGTGTSTGIHADKEMAAEGEVRDDRRGRRLVSRAVDASVETRRGGCG